MARIQIFSREGLRLAELEARAAREWILNGVSRCTWMMSQRDPKCRLDYLQYGNKVLIEHDDLPPWVGLIDSDDTAGRIWSSGGMVQITALSAGVVFDYGFTEIETLKGTAGSIYSQLIAMINEQDLVTRLDAGEIYMGGTDREETLGQSPLEHVQAVAGRAGNDWDVTGEVVAGILRLRANWYQKKGMHYERLLSEDKLEFSGNLLEEQGRIVNDLTGYGDASTDASRLAARQQVDDSISRMGRRRGSKVFDGNKVQGTLDANTKTEVETQAYPRIRTTFTVVNVDNFFRMVALGNSFPFHLDHAGFQPNGGFGWDGTARIVGMGFEDVSAGGKVKLVCEGGEQ